MRAQRWSSALTVPDLLDQDVLVRGWYRRNPAPVIEMRELIPGQGRRIRGFTWVVTYATSVILLVAGGATWLAPSLVS